MPLNCEPADTSHYLYWIALKKVPGVGNRMCRRLVDRFGDPAKIATASRASLLSIEGMNAKMADAVRAAVRDGKFADAVQREHDLVVRRGYRLITLLDREYPRLLLEIHDPPPYLYARGQSFDLSPAVAIVGSRHPTGYGISMAKRLGADLAARGFVVASGMATGIDAAAHQGALSAGGKTAAVLGSGLAVIYPPENRKLYHDIAASGVVLSELPVLEPPNAYNFPARNRIISGMTLGTVVVEAAQKSGSLITAKLAAEQGREVFAVPGSIKSCKSAGAHFLLKQGAKLVEKADDVIEEFTYLAGMGEPQPFLQGQSVPENGNNASMDLTQAESDVYCLLEPYPIHIDALACKTDMDAAGLLAVLLKLELMGMVVQRPGKFFMSSGE
ncbi:MAG: DNA-processing protein DprA [Desulfosalsimonadaceae bacterium]